MQSAGRFKIRFVPPSSFIIPHSSIFPIPTFHHIAHFSDYFFGPQKFFFEFSTGILPITFFQLRTSGYRTQFTLFELLLLPNDY
jgi:hypothetical protein